MVDDIPSHFLMMKKLSQPFPTSVLGKQERTCVLGYPILGDFGTEPAFLPWISEMNASILLEFLVDPSDHQISTATSSVFRRIHQIETI
jgi:hypothetical protein